VREYLSDVNAAQGCCLILKSQLLCEVKHIHVPYDKIARAMHKSFGGDATNLPHVLEEVHDLKLPYTPPLVDVEETEKVCHAGPGRAILHRDHKVKERLEVHLSIVRLALLKHTLDKHLFRGHARVRMMPFPAQFSLLGQKK
jgi:hypothetical protein